MSEKCGGVILCGGKSSRMGRPKALLPIGNEVFLQRIARILSQVVDPIVVVAAPGQELPPLPETLTVVRDEYDSLGPLAGLATGLGALRDRCVAAYVTSTDVPLLRPEFVREIVARLGDADLVIPRDGQYLQPLAACFRVAVEHVIRRLIAENRLRPVFLLELVRAIEIDVNALRAVDPELVSLLNCNTPEEYQRVLALNAANRFPR